MFDRAERAKLIKIIREVNETNPVSKTNTLALIAEGISKEIKDEHGEDVASVFITACEIGKDLPF